MGVKEDSNFLIYNFILYDTTKMITAKPIYLWELVYCSVPPPPEDVLLPHRDYHMGALAVRTGEDGGQRASN